MAFDLNAIASKKATTTVDFMGQSAVITYNPSFLTQESLSKYQNADDDEFMQLFCELVSDWDVKRGGKKVPLTPNGLKTVPVLFLRAVSRKITTDGAESVAEEGKVSNAG